MRTFKIKLSSWINYFLTYIFVVGILATTVVKLFSYYKVGLFILVILSIVILYYVTKITATALTVWTVTDKEIHIKWIRQFPFHKKKSDKTIDWEEIKAYKLGSDKVFDRFKLVLKDETVLKYWHNNLITKDDFDQFINYFISRVEAHNRKEFARLIKR